MPLSIRFQKILLDLLEKEIGPSFKKEKKEILNKHKNAFYVYAEKKEFNSLKDGIEYVTRYCGRVPISENRIVAYDGENVTFSYIDHKDELYHEKTVTAEAFIMILLKHLIPHQYKIIRYYGFYRKKHKLHNKVKLLINKEKRNIRKQFLKYELSILKSFHRNPYNCPKCKHKFEAPIEAVHEFEQEDEWNGLPISTPPYTVCSKCKYNKCVPMDYQSKRGYHHIYKEEN